MPAKLIRQNFWYLAFKNHDPGPADQQTHEAEHNRLIQKA